MLGITTIPNYAYAMPSEENAAIDTVAAYVKEMQKNLVMKEPLLKPFICYR